MNLAFRHTGLQFFFITLTLEGRPQVLSRIIKGEKGGEVELLPPGEIVVAFLRAVHAVYPAVTISDRQIMPDHIHFLMIVRYDQAPDFNPLWVSFALMKAIEEAWAQVNGGCAPAPLPNATGEQPTARPTSTLTPPQPTLAFTPAEAAKLFAATLARERVEAAAISRLMSQGLSRAGALAQLSPPPAGARGFTQPTPPPAGARGFTQPNTPLQGARGFTQPNTPLQGARGFTQPTPPPAGARGAQPPVRSALRFDRRAYIELSFDSRQLKAIRRYIRLNPNRLLWKRLHPDRFVRYANIGHAILDPSRTWAAMGNLTLLGSPFLIHARLTLKKSLAEHEAAIRDLVAKAQRGAVIVSGFISPGEVELLKRLKATPTTRFIKMLPCALPPRYDPSAEDSRELAADRLLILSGFTNTTPHISALDMRRDPAAAHLFRANCLEMNALAAALCERATALETPPKA